ncbi:HipA family kinase [Stenotrophomonas sp.]|uniref:HipA family kinase n=1 Tax=Stenotrophomonas sp. TaxID=69392 RepID=UPI002D72C6FE|nr:HipA family kinase [Stenotrophomonas sp.]HYQ25116.1 HipA family kinase [Stenotrophomonas sp.]
MSFAKPPVYIEEILRRSDQGITRPFLCRGDDNSLYYVKGSAANKRSLICEWMAGTLASGFGLNVPQFEIAYVPDGLADLHPEGRDLGSGPVFASQAAYNLNEILFVQAGRVPLEVRRDVIAFDWWVRNADRSLTATGGNPNLLWDAASSNLVVIDHNQAFDPDFDPGTFLATHVFQAEFAALSSDLMLMAHYADRMKATLDLWWDNAWGRVPGEWLYHDDEQTIPTDFDPAASLALVARCYDQDLWRLP